MVLPTMRQRKALCEMTPGYPERASTFRAGEKTIAELLSNEWITEEKLPSGDLRYFITPCGLAARSMKTQPAPKRTG